MDIKKVQARPISRIAASIMDALTVVMAFFIYLLIASSIIVATSGYKNAVNNYNAERDSSGLYVLVENEYKFAYDVEYDVTKADEYDGLLVHFYQERSAESELVKYQQSKEDSKYVDAFNEGTVTFNVENPDKVKAFFADSYNTANDYLISHSKDAGVISNCNMIATLVPAFLSLFTIYFVVPMIYKDGETFGKKMFGIKLAKYSEGELYRVRKLQIFIRFLVISILEVLLSLFTFGVPLLVSTICMFATKDKVAIHDMLARTYVIDKNSLESEKIIAKKSENASNIDIESDSSESVQEND